MRIHPLFSILILLGAVAGCSPAPRDRGFIRVDQVGFLPGENKTAYLLSPREAAGERVSVVDGSGRSVWSGRIGSSRGPWNDRYRFVDAIEFTTLQAPGTYRLRAGGKVAAEPPPFHIGSTLFDPLTADAVQYFREHRDNAHADDQQATVYAAPVFGEDGRARGPLDRVGGPVDVAGGWYDAGDYEKFTHSAAYALILMLLAQRDHPAVPGLTAETRYGLDWLDRMWHSDTLLTQVGIGDGISVGDRNYLGDHDTWRPPTADRPPAAPGDPAYYQRHRPVFRAAAPGRRISPNLAGRVAAAFALAAQVEASGDPHRARAHLAAAAALFAHANTDPAGELITTEPRDYYPEDSWHDDLALAATELARGATALHDPRAAGWARKATHWARVLVDDDYTDSLSVYDVSALADAELGPLLAATPISGAEISPAELYSDLRSRVAAGAARAATDPLDAAAGSGGSDYAALELGYAAIADLYRTVTGDRRYAAFATAQRGVALGANGWGTSLVIGAGTTYPRCPHDPAGDLAPHHPAPVGAVVNGPNRTARVRQLLRQSRPSPCTNPGDFSWFDQPTIAYTDDAGVSATTEPAVDFTATGLFAFALAQRPAAVGGSTSGRRRSPGPGTG